MTVTLELPADIAVLAEAEAKRRSLLLAEYVAEVVAEALTHSGQTERIAASLSLLDALDTFGGEEEQRETFEFLREAIDKDRTSARRLFN